MRFLYLLHQRAARAQMRMGIQAVSQEPSLLAYPKRYEMKTQSKL